MTRIKANILLLLIVAVGLFVISCSKDSSSATTPTTPEKTTVTVTGDINETYEGKAMFGVSTYTSGGSKQYFSITVLPLQAGTNPLAMTLMYKSGSTPFTTGTYAVGTYAFGSDIPAGKVAASFAGKSTPVTDGYFFDSGTLTISSVSAEKITGSCTMQGHYKSFMTEDVNRKITVTINFIALPEGSNTDPNTTTESFELYKNGVKWTADKSLTAMRLFEDIIITAKHTDATLGTEKIELTLQDASKNLSGTFGANMFSGSWASYQNDKIAPIMLVSTSGIYNITKLGTDAIEGTFSFTTDNNEGTGTIEFKTGKFKVKLAN